MNSTDLERLEQIFRIVLDLPDEMVLANLERGNDARWDSLGTVNLVVAIESEFQIKLDSDEIERLTAFTAAKDVVQSKISR